MKRIEIHYNFTRIFLKILINFSIKNNNKEIIISHLVRITIWLGIIGKSFYTGLYQQE